MTDRETGSPGGLTPRWLTVFLDFPGESFGAGVAFWRSVTGYGLSPARGVADEFATLLPRSGDAYLRVQRIASGTGGCHLDLHIDTAASPLTAAADRAAALGARVRYHEPGELIVAESPGGFTFCLVPWDGEAVVPAPCAGGDDRDGGGDVDVEPGRLDTLCLDVPPERFEGECSFWSALTGWAGRAATVPGFTVLRRPPGMPVSLLLQRLNHAGDGQRVRGHADFGVAAPDLQRAVARHVGLGARVVGAHPHWTVLADPASREYCLVSRGT